MKRLIIKAGQLSYFLLISVPLACLLYVTAHLYFEAKRLFKAI